MNMPHICMWKSRPAWNTAKAAEQERVRSALRRLIRKFAEPGDDTCGPFLHSSDRGELLIWHVPSTYGSRLDAEYERILGNYFEPVMFGPAGDLTAKDFAERLG